MSSSGHADIHGHDAPRGVLELLRHAGHTNRQEELADVMTEVIDVDIGIIRVPWRGALGNGLPGDGSRW